MKKRLNWSTAAVSFGMFLVIYFAAYLISVQREEFLFDGQFARIVPQGSLHRVPSYRFEDNYRVIDRLFRPAHTVDVLVRPRYWSRPDNR
jgi:hypothetical protein